MHMVKANFYRKAFLSDTLVSILPENFVSGPPNLSIYESNLKLKYMSTLSKQQNYYDNNVLQTTSHIVRMLETDLQSYYILHQ